MSKVNYWKKPAEQGGSNAQYYLGNAYWKEWDNENHNQEQAIEWWQKAAEQRHLIAQYNLGIAYKNGFGVTEDCEKALQWLRKVAEHDKENDPLVISAQYRLGKMFKDGLGKCSQNLQEAEYWFSKAYAGEKGNENDFSKGDILTEEKVILGEKDIQKGLIDTIRDSALEALLDIEKIQKIEEQEKAKQELEDVMAMFAHKFRGPLQSIQYNVEHENQKKVTLQAVQMMAGLLNIFSTIATKPQQLRKKLQQDMQGSATILGVLEKALMPVMTQVLTINNTQKIRQHYLHYAKANGKVPMTTTRKQWVEDYDVEEQLQTMWENSFSELLAEPRLNQSLAWLKARFFSLELSGFDDDSIHFEHYGATESVLIIVMTEILLNTFKYYSSQTNEPVKLHWQHDQDFCHIICENPSHRSEQRIDKGSKKGHNFLNIIAHNLEGEFPEPLSNNPYRVEWYVPTDLFVKKENV